jgi:Zn finger protein HypA/HybF involved in hydrogenase expression
VAAEDHIVEILEDEEVGDIQDVRLEIGPRGCREVHAFAEASEGGGEDFVAQGAELARQRCDGPGATPAAGD